MDNQVPFYKTLLIKVGVYESEIIDERHFSTPEEIETFKDTNETAENKCVTFMVR